MARWRVYRYWKMGMTLVTYQMDTVDTFQDALKWAFERGIVNNKKRGVLYKQEGDKRRIYDEDDYAWHYGGYAKRYNEKHKDTQKPPPEAPPLELPAPTPIEPKQVPMWEEQWVDNPPLKSTNVWKYSKPTKRRL